VTVPGKVGGGAASGWGVPGNVTGGGSPVSGPTRGGAAGTTGTAGAWPVAVDGIAGTAGLGAVVGAAGLFLSVAPPVGGGTGAPVSWGLGEPLVFTTPASV